MAAAVGARKGDEPALARGSFHEALIHELKEGALGLVMSGRKSIPGRRNRLCKCLEARGSGENLGTTHLASWTVHTECKKDRGAG